MRAVATVFLVLTVVGCAVGMIPCFGWLNWAVVPLSGACALLGLVGLIGDRNGRDTGIFAAALLVGALVIGLSALRCMLGGGIF